MCEIKALLAKKGYTQSGSDRLWENWLLPHGEGHYKVMVSRLANNVMLYEMNEKGKPLSYAEFHNVTEPRQIRRLAMNLDFALAPIRS